MRTELLPPDLPEATRTRWQPLRLGLVEIFRYDSEEFWFRDGHLMLRGNNGTGKSKVLSLTLPFLLDANLSAARVEPDGDRTKRMEWNLLMGGRYEKRVGDTWLELGRRDESGAQHFLTLGCGLRAIGGRSTVDAWFFITEQRIRGDLWLMNRERVPLLRERLVEAIGSRGQVFQSAKDYKRAVDERLFKLNEERYAALVNTLIQLRQPQLSKNPDEQRLSNALSEALTPLDRDALEVVAESMSQLEQQEEQLKQLEEMSRAITAFLKRYRQYARVATRRRARVLRQAQTQFDDTSREFNLSQQKLDQASAAAAGWLQQCQQLHSLLSADAETIRVLESDPTMLDAKRIDDAAKYAAGCRASYERARSHLEKVRQQLSQSQQQLARAREEAQQTRDGLTRAADQVSRRAQEAGIAPVATQTLEAAGFPDGLAGPGEALLDTLRAQMQQAEVQRREQIHVIRKRLAQVAQAADQCAAAREKQRQCAERFEEATGRSQAALAAVEDAGAQLVSRWQTHVAELQVLAIANAAELLEELELWVGSLSGPNPLRGALDLAWTAEESRLATLAAGIEQRRQELLTEREALSQERAVLESGVTPQPPAPHTRLAEDRATRGGAPLWQLVDFAPKVTPRQRAGLEAALEAAGLLDAWVMPDGKLLAKGSHDVLLEPRAPQPKALSGWLVPSIPADGAAATVRPDTVLALLRSISCADVEPATAESWVSAEGRFRVGPARGSWHKDTAQYIGHAAREAARRARLAAIAARLAEIAAQLLVFDEETAAIEARRARSLAEQAGVAGEEELHAAHAARHAAEEERRRSQVALGEAESRLAQAQSTLDSAREILELDARSLRLPADAQGVDEIEGAVHEYRADARELTGQVRLHLTSLRDLGERQEREQQVRGEAEEAAGQHLQTQQELATAEQTVKVLRESVGKAVEQLLSELAAARKSRQQHETEHTAAQDQRVAAASAASAAAADRDNLQLRLTERTEARRQAIDSLQAFAGHTGFFGVAVPEVTLPDLATAWGIEAALGAARRAEAALADVADGDADWSRIQNEINHELQQLQTTLSTQAHRANADISDLGLVVSIVYHERAERPDTLEQLLAEEIQQRRLSLTAQERAILENHLQSEIAAHLQTRIVETQERVQLINTELLKRPTSTGVRYRLEWQPLPEQSENAVAGLAEARRRLLKTRSDAWSAEDRRQVGEFLRQRIQAERARDDQSTLSETLARALDYRRWHQFRVQRQQDRQWKPLSGPASSGERALGLTVPLFAAASSHYWSAHERSPRLVLLDEAFAGIDDEARANCMALIREFDLDFVMTSEREWGCYAELPGLAICQLSQREGMDAVLVTRWSWDGRERRRQSEPAQRFPAAEADDSADAVMDLDLT